MCHGPNREGTDNGVPLIYGDADPANNIAAGAPRFTAATIRAVVQTGNNRMPALPHLSVADLDEPQLLVGVHGVFVFGVELVEPTPQDQADLVDLRR